MTTRLTPGGIARVEHVIEVLVKHGLDAPELARCSSWRGRGALVWRKLRRWQGPRRPWPLAVRDALIELGPAFIKLGQILSVRSDLIPQEFADALKTLQEDVPPAPFREVRKVIERELGSPIDASFEAIEPTPLAAGSVAQVYRARTCSGRQVVLKVRRPGIETVLANDMEVVNWLAGQIEYFSAAARRLHLSDAAKELARYTQRELDFRIEGDVTTRVRRFFLAWPEVRIPEVILSRSGLLVLEYLDTFPITDVAALKHHAIDRDEIVRTAVRTVLAQIYELGIFHGDPHPGNMRVTPHGQLVFLDFGIAGELSQRLRLSLLASALHAARGEIEQSLVYLLAIATPEPGATTGAFRLEITKRYEAWSGSSAKEYGFGQLVYDQVTLGAEHGLRFPPDTVLFTKALLTLEGVALEIAPGLYVSSEAIPFFEGLARREYAWERLVERLAWALPDWVELIEHASVAGLRSLDNWRDAAATSGRDPPPATILAPALFGGLAMVTGALLLVDARPATAHEATFLGAMLVVTGLFAGLRGLRG